MRRPRSFGKLPTAKPSSLRFSGSPSADYDRWRQGKSATQRLSNHNSCKYLPKCVSSLLPRYDNLAVPGVNSRQSQDEMVVWQGVCPSGAPAPFAMLKLASPMNRHFRPSFALPGRPWARDAARALGLDEQSRRVPNLAIRIIPAVVGSPSCPDNARLPARIPCCAITGGERIGLSFQSREVIGSYGA